jgi:hypothetical protein
MSVLIGYQRTDDDKPKRRETMKTDDPLIQPLIGKDEHSDPWMALKMALAMLGLEFGCVNPPPETDDEEAKT